ncbi:hypothetical protein RF11_01525 [Thelohanellus kitauei]|uniref:Uncharacterized protein n=1 Tax=Thelohanellus kitauei TaxID=669202 RepID=A0A0C2MNZ2_THEKT|nr:hypothetical protein RF11_01525 [Thelohanellus kitauei]
MTVKLNYEDSVNKTDVKNETLIFHLKHIRKPCYDFLMIGRDPLKIFRIKIHIILSLGNPDIIFTEYNFVVTSITKDKLYALKDRNNLLKILLYVSTYSLKLFYGIFSTMNISEHNFKRHKYQRYSCVAVMHLSQVVYLKYKNLESADHNYSTTVLVEIKIVNKISNELLLEVNMTGWRTECISLHETHLMAAYFIYDPYWTEFNLEMMIMDVTYQTIEYSEMLIRNGTLNSSNNVDFRLINVIFEPFLPYMFQNIYDYNFLLRNTWIPLLKYKTIVYHCNYNGTAMILTEYVFKGTTIKNSLESESRVLKDNELLIPVKENIRIIQKCKTSAYDLKTSQN